jgi:RNA polymerase sigma-70 factor (ECF subfamily)
MSPTSDDATVPDMGSSDARSRSEERSLTARLEGHRRELRSYCQRMLGSGFEAEDAVQETLVRAWRAYDRFDGRSSLRHWLYRIATNVCITMLRGPQRRARPSLEAVADGWAGPMSADATDATDAADPAEVVASRDAVRRAFVVALQALPPRQRAALLLQDVLRWRANEVAELLGTTEASVRSAVQRARATLAANADVGMAAATSEPNDDAQRDLLARYVDAFERTDVQKLVALLRLDHATTTAA